MKRVVAGMAAVMVLTAVARTAGWENVNRNRQEFPITTVVWSANPALLIAEKLDGAEGKVSISADGIIAIDKTNGKGRIVVRGAPFKVATNQAVRLLADVSVTADDYLASKGYVCAVEPGKPFERKDHVGGKWFNAGGEAMYRMVNTAPGMTYRKYNHAVSQTGLLVPAIVVEGAPCKSVWKGFLAEDLTTAQISWEAFLKERKVPDRKDEMMELDEFERMIASDADHYAEIRTVDSKSVLFVDGKPAVPMVYKESHMFFPAEDQIVYAGAPLHRGGVRIGIVETSFALDCGDTLAFWRKDGYDVTRAALRIRDEMRVAHDSVILLSISVNAYPEFTAEHPEEMWRKEDGSVVYGSYGSADEEYDSGGDLFTEKKRWPWVSYSSEVYRNAVVKNLAALWAELKRMGLSKRIIGFHFSGYHDGQFAMPFPDYSTCAKREYEKFRAEGNEGKAFEYFSLQTGFRVQEYFARKMKTLAGKPTIVARWCMLPFFGTSGTYDITSFVHSDAIDVICPQPTYVQRSPGLGQGWRLPTATFHDHRKMMWMEFDLRTYAAYETWGRSVTACKGLNQAEDVEMWRTIHRKHAGMLMAQNMGWWYYDMAGGWYYPQEIAEEVCSVYRYREAHLSERTRTWHPDAVVVVSEYELSLYNRPGYPKVPNAAAMVLPQWPNLSMSGCPYDIRLVEDFIENPALVKCYKAAALVGFAYPTEVQQKLMKSFDEAGVKHFTVTKTYSARHFHDFVVSAGGYAASEPGIQIDMNGNFMSVHALKTEIREIVLPFPCQVINVFNGAVEATKDGKLCVDMSSGETCWFQLLNR